MTKVGVIAEYNPFHNGHLYHLNKVKEMFKESTLILVLIGNFTQRGEPSMIDKWCKTKIALEEGFDLVVELPFDFATSSSDIYADGAIQILNVLGCDYLVFGSETNDVSFFYEASKKILYDKNYQRNTKAFIDKGFSYPSANALALKKITNKEIKEPNDLLALSYIKSIITTKSMIKPVSIKRTTSYHGDITSASNIRKNINDECYLKKVMPKENIKYLRNISLNDYFNFIKYEIITQDDLSIYKDVDEGLENKLKKAVKSATNIDDLIKLIKSKRYPYNKLQRMLLHILCKTLKNTKNEISYIRVLGLDDKGKEVIKDARKKSSVPIITKVNKTYLKLLKNDFKAAEVYALKTKYNPLNDLKASIKK